MNKIHNRELFNYDIIALVGDYLRLDNEIEYNGFFYQGHMFLDDMYNVYLSQHETLYWHYILRHVIITKRRLLWPQLY